MLFVTVGVFGLLCFMSHPHKISSHGLSHYCYLALT